MNKQQKYWLYIIGFLAMCFLIYNFSIKKTAQVRKQYLELINEKAILDNATQKGNYLVQKNKYLDSLLSSNNLSLSNTFQQILFQKITQFSEDKELDIIEFNEPHVLKQKSTNTETYSFELKGDFNNILKLINHIERHQLGELISVNYQKKKNYRTNRSYLTAKIFLRRVSQ